MTQGIVAIQEPQEQQGHMDLLVIKETEDDRDLLDQKEHKETTIAKFVQVQNGLV